MLSSAMLVHFAGETLLAGCPKYLLRTLIVLTTHSVLCHLVPDNGTDEERAPLCQIGAGETAGTSTCGAQ